MHWVYFWIERTDDLFIFQSFSKANPPKLTGFLRIFTNFSQDQQQLSQQDFPPKCLKPKYILSYLRIQILVYSRSRIKEDFNFNSVLENPFRENKSYKVCNVLASKSFVLTLRSEEWAPLHLPVHRYNLEARRGCCCCLRVQRRTLTTVFTSVVALLTHGAAGKNQALYYTKRGGNICCCCLWRKITWILHGFVPFFCVRIRYKHARWKRGICFRIQILV